MIKYKDRRPPKEDRTLRHGDIRGDGMVFIQYQRHCVGGEQWTTPGKFEARRVRMAQYYQDNRERALAVSKKYVKNRRRTDWGFRMKRNMRDRLRKALNGQQKCSTTMSLVGCTLPELRSHLESGFADGMTWENYGYTGWHIDHIKPCSSFDLTLDSEQKTCFHYTNLQPLWAEDNYKKGNKII